jgi:hypothetical protein
MLNTSINLCYLVYNFDFVAPSIRVAAAEANTTVSLSFTFVAVEMLNDHLLLGGSDPQNITFDPSFHISVTKVSPGYTTPANLGVRLSRW